MESTVAASGFARALRERTALLHARAERTGIVREILRGKASRHGYALFLRNLLPAYLALERGLEQRRDAPGVSAIARPELYRSAALTADLEALYGPSWKGALPLLGAAQRYAHRIRAAARGSGALLVAHAYVRHLGDLSGGTVLCEVLTRSPGLAMGDLSFYRFAAIADPVAYKAGYRQGLDRAGEEMAEAQSVVEEAATAFALNIAVSQEVLAASERD